MQLLIHVFRKGFCKTCEPEIVLQEWKSKKNNFRFTSLTKHVNNQTNCRITLKNLKKTWICLIFIYVAVKKEIKYHYQWKYGIKCAAKLRLL